MTIKILTDYTVLPESLISRQDRLPFSSHWNGRLALQSWFYLGPLGHSDIVGVGSVENIAAHDYKNSFWNDGTFDVSATATAKVRRVLFVQLGRPPRIPELSLWNR